MSKSFLCSCGGDTSVMDSRPNTNGSVRRRRKCLACSKRFTTWEMDFDKYHDMLRQLDQLVVEAGRIVRSVGPERGTQH